MNETKAAVSNAPSVVCKLLSPYMSKVLVAQLLTDLNSNQLLLEKVIECANQHMVLATLYSQLLSNSLDRCLPEELSAYMKFIHKEQESRNKRLTKQALNLVKKLNSKGINPLIMKGADTLFYDLYPTLGARFMSDLDILLPPATMDLSWNILLKEGYEVPKKYLGTKVGIDPHHAKPLYKSGHDSALELHFKPLNSKSGNFLSTEEGFQEAFVIEGGDAKSVDMYSFSPEHKILHCFVHSEISHGNQKHDLLDIRQMDYFVRLVMHYEGRTDWSLINSQLAKAGYEEDFAIYCYKASKLFSLPEIGSTPKKSQKQLEQSYRAGIRSAMIQYYPIWKFHLGFIHILGVFSKERLAGQYDVSTLHLYAKAVFQRCSTLLFSPNVVLKRIRVVLFGAPV